MVAAAAALLPLLALVPSGPYHARASALRSTSAKLGFSWVPPRDSNALTEEQAQANRAAAAAAAGIDGYLMPGEESTVGNSPIITEIWTFGVDHRRELASRRPRTRGTSRTRRLASSRR